MRTVLAILLVVAAPVAARAQTCSGLFTGTISLALDEGGTVTPLPAAAAAHFFSAAECACHASDVRARILVVQALPASQTGIVELWEGVGCDSYATRIEQDSPCHRIAVGSIADFTTTGVISFPVPSDLCGHAASALTLVAFTDAYNNLATCTLPIQPSQGRPAQPTTLGGARNPDGSITVQWQRPADNPLAPTTAYQIVCADENGGRLVDPPVGDSAYSICLPNDVLERRTTGVASDGTLGGGSFAALDHGFLCSPPLAAASTSFTLSGLPPTRAAQFAVVAVDDWGDASASAVVTVPAVMPHHGGCSVVAGAAPAPTPLVLLVAFATMMAWTSCRQAHRSTTSTASSATSRRAAWARSTRSSIAASAKGSPPSC
jgi:hypothetical protein